MAETVASSLKTAAKGILLVFAGMVSSHALLFFAKLLIVRNLSKDDLGVYSLSVGIISIVSLVASLGLWEGSTRYISVFLGQGRNADADAVRRSSLRIGALSGFTACFLVFLLSGAVSQHAFYKPELSAPLRVMSFFVPAYVMTLVLASILRGYGIIRFNVYFMDIGQPLIFLVLISIIFLLGFTFISVVSAYVLSMAAACALLAYFGRRDKEMLPVMPHTGKGFGRDLLHFSIPVLSIDVMYLLFRWTDTLTLGRYGTAEQVGVYSVSVSLAVMLSLPLFALGYVFMPIAGDLYAKNRWADLARTYQVLTKWIFAVTLPVFFVLFFFPEMTITLLFGGRFVDSALPLRILSLGYLFTAFLGTNSMLLLVFGLSRAVMKVSAAGVVLNILLNYTLIKHLGLGIKGAALATMASLVAVSFSYSFLLYRSSRIHPLSTGYLKPVAGSVAIGLLIYAAAKNLPLHFWMLPAYFLLYVGGYLLSLLMTRSLDEEDIVLLVTLLNRAGADPDLTKRIVRKIYRGNTEKIDLP